MAIPTWLALHRRRWLLLAAVAVALAAGHAPLLRCVTRPLTADLPADAEAQAVWIVESDSVTADGDRAYAAAAEFYHRQPSRKVVLCERAPGRLAELGIYPTFETVCRRELEKAGVPREAVEVVARNTTSFWDEARQMGRWLNDHPEARVLMLCDPLSSGNRATILRRCLAAEPWARISLRTLPNREFDLARWWRSRTGLKKVMFAWLDWVYIRWQGEGATPRRLNVAAYEARAAQSLEAPTP